MQSLLRYFLQREQIIFEGFTLKDSLWGEKVFFEAHKIVYQAKALL